MTTSKKNEQSTEELLENMKRIKKYLSTFRPGVYGSTYVTSNTTNEGFDSPPPPPMPGISYDDD